MVFCRGGQRMDGLALDDGWLFPAAKLVFSQWSPDSGSADRRWVYSVKH
jgi:hypothetical protein